MSATTTASAEHPAAAAAESVYTRAFWLSYAANLSLVTANALTFRFAELVNFLGGTEKTSGYIVGVGTIAALGARLLLGQAIDRYGVRKLWTLSSISFLAGTLLFYFSNNLGWQIYVARSAFAIGLAGMFTCSIVHIQGLVPVGMRTEIIGSLGSSGFVGMILGTNLGDQIFLWFPDGSARFHVLFACAFAIGLFYVAAVRHLTRFERHEAPRHTPAAHLLAFKYWIGYLILVAFMMGTGYTVISVFLTRYATHLGIEGIGSFFTGYCASAFLFRIVSRDWSQSVGRHRMILLGLAGHCVGNWTLPFVTHWWHFLFPSLCCGFGHALLFPAVVSMGAGKFPPEYRGSGTTLVLGFVELGAAICAPFLGWIIDHFDHAGFPQMFFTTGTTAAVIGVIYYFTAARQPDVDHHGHSTPPTGGASESKGGARQPADSPSGEIAPFPLG